MKRLSVLGRRFAALALAAAVLVSAAPRVYADDDKLNDLRSDYSAAEERLNQIKEQIKSTDQNVKDTKANRQNQLDAQVAIGAQITSLKEQIEIISADIAEKEQQIDDKQKEIDAKQAEFDARWAGFKQRMAAMQMLNEGGAIALLSSVTNLYELLTFSQAMEDIAARDDEICDELEAQRVALSNDKAELEQIKAELEANQAELEEQRIQLGAKWDELRDYIAALDGEIASGEETLDSLAAEQATAEKEFQAAALALSAYLEAQNEKYHNPTMHCSLDFGVPLQAYSRLTTDFGENGHLGHDIAAPRGTPIYAVADGIVTAAGYHDHPQSYGNYVQILHGSDDEGREFSTLYAHMCEWPSVSEGQTVVRGQVIGYVGNTGYSFGNHLHLEMKINGTRVDALDYCPLP